MTTPPDHAPHSPPTAPTFFFDSNFLCLSSSSLCPTIQDCSCVISWNANPSSHVSRNWAPCLTRRTALSGYGHRNWVWFCSVVKVILIFIIHSTIYMSGQDSTQRKCNYYMLLVIIIGSYKGCGYVIWLLS